MFAYLDSMWINFFTWYTYSYIVYIWFVHQVTSLGALCYAEIGTLIPRNGAEVVYMKEGILLLNICIVESV